MSGIEPLGIVCDALRAPALQEIAERFEIAAVVPRGRRFRVPSGVRLVVDLAGALRAGARSVAVLSPGGDFGADVAHCVDAGVPIVAAGPLVADSPDAGSPDAGDHTVWVPGRGRAQLTVERARTAAARAAFGHPVFLRWMTGGGGSAAGAWWSLLEGLDVATLLLGEPPDHGWLTAHHSGRRWHIVSTAVTASGASAQLVVTPGAVPGDELMLLGSGGLIQSEGACDGGLVQNAAGAARLLRLEPAWPDSAWIEAALAVPEAATAAAVARACACLRALRRAARQRRPVPLPV